jgi:hypothetical protein
MISTIKIRNSRRKPAAGKSRENRRIISGKLYRISERKRKETHLPKIRRKGN